VEQELTALLRAWRQGDAAAGERLVPQIYAELRALARRRLAGERHADTLQPTALVNEAFLRLLGQGTDFRDRTHFFAVASTVMRHVLVDHARSRLAQKRPPGEPLTLITDLPGSGEPDVELLDLDRALERLAGEHPRPARVVEMRFFAGLGEEEIAAVLAVTSRTVARDWAFARAWLLRELGRGGPVA
jgi:RNA polymerase sigma factor (TIGR02999 family)